MSDDDIVYEAAKIMNAGVLDRPAVATALKQIIHCSGILFATRYDMFRAVYKDSFDNHPEAIKIIARPNFNISLSHTEYMAYLEARFSVESDQHESIKLASMWTKLNSLQGTGHDPLAAIVLEQVNNTMREKILGIGHMLATALDDIKSPDAPNHAVTRSLQTFTFIQQQLQSLTKECERYTK